MAKSKRSAALFEVIQSSRIQKSHSALRFPKTWFKRRPPKVDVTTSAAPLVVETSAPAAADDTAVAASSPKPTIQQTIPGVDLQLDPDRQQITFKVSYNSAIVTAFTVLVTIGLAYAVGRKMNRGPVAATASPSSAELRALPAHPDVLDLKTGNNAGLASQDIDAKHSADNAELASLKMGATTLPSSDDSQRVIGRQYVVIQIYPDKKNAQDAAAILNTNKIPCTVENGVPGWASKSWWCVVGTTGFDHIRGNADYAQYETIINRVSEQFAANSKFKKFEPHPYRWKEPTA